MTSQAMTGATITSATTTPMVVVAAAADAKEITDADVADEDTEDDNNTNLENVVCYTCNKKGHYLTGCRAPKKNGYEESNMVSKADFKNILQSTLKEML
jgi:hypothetical protein